MKTKTMTPNMQTFLPYSDFERTMKALDYRRLGKQRVEAHQILNILLGRTTKKGWQNHPAVLMWKGYENSLKLYYNCAVREWVSRGYNNTMKLEEVQTPVHHPVWLGNVQFHRSHRSNLLRKDYKYYSKKFVAPEGMEYVWPSKLHNLA